MLNWRVNERAQDLVLPELDIFSCLLPQKFDCKLVTWKFRSFMGSPRNGFWTLVLGLGGLLCLYPVFFLYHGMLAFNLLPQFVPLVLGGLFGHVSAFVLLLFTFFQVWSRFEKRNFQKTNADWLFWLFLAYISWALIWTGINVGFFHKDYTSEVAIKLFSDNIFLRDFQ